MSGDFVVDSCLLIEYFRVKDKSKTFLARLIREGRQMGLSTIVLFEILAGANADQRNYWKDFLHNTVRLPFDERVAGFAADLFRELRRKNRNSEPCDLFIAATAMAYDLPLATLNRKHFEPIEGLKLLLPEPK